MIKAGIDKKIGTFCDVVNGQTEPRSGYECNEVSSVEVQHPDLPKARL